MAKSEIIDIKNGDVTGDKKPEIIILKGIKSEDNNNYFNSLELVVQDGDIGEKYTLKIDNSGYRFALYVADFNNDEKDEILICGEEGGSGGYVIGKIYEVIEGSLRIIFNSDNFSQDYKYTAKYLDKYLVNVFSEKYNRNFNFYIGDSFEGYLNEIYDKNGKVKGNNKPTISFVNSIYPIENILDGGLELILIQRIIGVANADIIGAIETRINLKNNVVNLIRQYGLTVGQEKEEVEVNKKDLDSVKKILGKDIRIIDLQKFDYDEEVITLDFDNDGKDELLCCYSKGNKIYLSIFRKEKDKLNFLDAVEFSEGELKDLIVKPIRRKEINNIVIGFEKSSIWNSFKIFELKYDKFKNVFREEEQLYSKLEVDILDDTKKGVNELIIWSHITGEAYEVTIYSHFGRGFQSTTKYDKIYFPKVEEYYRELIFRTRETPTYLYYLADTLYRCGNKNESIFIIDKVINSLRPYPSLDEAKRFKKKVLGS